MGIATIYIVEWFAKDKQWHPQQRCFYTTFMEAESIAKQLKQNDPDTRYRVVVYKVNGYGHNSKEV